MRDAAARASSADVDSLQSHLHTYLTHLVRAFAAYRQAYGQIPRDSALEIRHFCVHGAAFHDSLHDNDAKYRHMQAMVGHAQQAMLAAFRAFFARALPLDSSPRPAADTALIREFATCRTRELQEGLSGEYTNTASRYRQLLDRLYQAAALRQPVPQTLPLATFRPQMWPLIREWLELDQLLSAIARDHDRHTGALQLLIESLLFHKDHENRDSLLRMQTCLIMQKLQVSLITMHTHKADFHVFASNRNSLHIPEYFNEHIRNEQSTDFSHYIRVVRRCFPLVARYWDLRYALA